MDEESQEFCLRWHHHQNSLTTALGSMLGSGSLADVTLSAGGKTVKAHRLVLASCSDYFAHLFKELSSESGALVIVLNCSPVELHLLLTFMYTGEVTCTRSGLPDLLRLAHSLRVEGLTDANSNLPTLSSMQYEDKQCSETHSSTPEPTLPPSPLPPPASPPSPLHMRTLPPPLFPLHEPHPSYTDIGYDFTNEYSNELVAELMKKEKPLDGLSKLDQIVQQLYSSHKDMQSSLPLSPVRYTPANADIPEPRPHERKWRLHTGGAVCTICNKRLSNQYNLRVHLETHAGTRHACHSCSHVSRSRDALRKHVAYRHPSSLKHSQRNM